MGCACPARPLSAVMCELCAWRREPRKRKMRCEEGGGGVFVVSGVVRFGLHSLGQSTSQVLCRVQDRGLCGFLGV
jgi:hypothetical protein